MKTSSAKADYVGNDGAGVHLEIADISGVSGLMDLADGLLQNNASESDSGFEKDVLSGSGVDMHSLEQFLGEIDLAHLESMKGVGAQSK